MSAPSSGPDLRPAHLDESALADVRALEDRLGTPVVAYEAESPYATLSAEQLEEIRRAEIALGVRLLAYRIPHPPPVAPPPPPPRARPPQSRERWRQ